MSIGGIYNASKKADVFYAEHIKKVSLKKQALFTIYEKCDIISQNEVH